MPQALRIADETASKPDATCREGIWHEPAERTAFEIVATFREGKKGKWFPSLARKISRDKPAAYIAHLTGEKERTCYDWCSGAFDPPARVIIKLLHSPVGGIVFEHLMKGCAQRWMGEIESAKADAAKLRKVQLDLGV